jgi:hypothetical protein
MQHMCVCPSSETRRKRDHTEGEEGRAVTRPLLFMVSTLFRVMLTVVHGLSVRRVFQCAGGARLRASESSEAENERDVFFFFFSVRGTTEGSRDDFHYASWCASSLDKEDGWEFAYLL